MTDEAPIAYTLPRAAKRIGLGATKLREIVRAGEIPFSKVGDLTMIEDVELVKWLRAQRPAQFREPK